MNNFLEEIGFGRRQLDPGKKSQQANEGNGFDFRGVLGGVMNTAALATAVTNATSAVTGAVKETIEKLSMDTLNMSRVYHDVRKAFIMADHYGLPGTDGTMWSNIKANVKSYSTVFSMCYIHPLSPFSRGAISAYNFSNYTFLFFITAIFEMIFEGTELTGVGATVLLSCVVMILFSLHKAFLFTFIACPCLYIDQYNELTGHGSIRTSIEQSCTIGGNYVAGCACAMSIIYLVVGAIIVRNYDHTTPEEFVVSWVIAQAVTLVVWDILLIAFKTAAHFKKEKARFHERWSKYLANPDGGEAGGGEHQKKIPPPNGFSDLARIARDRHEGEIPQEYSKWNEWFYL